MDTIPCQRLDWLGITWDSASGTIEIVDRRVAKITSTIDSTIDSDFVLCARRLASFTGQIISTAPVCGNISRIMTKHCIMSTLSAEHWNSKVKMDPYCIKELYFWKNNLNSIKVHDCFLLISHSVWLTPMPVLQGAVQLLPLMRIVCVTSFGSIQSVLRALLGESLQPLIFL